MIPAPLVQEQLCVIKRAQMPRLPRSGNKSGSGPVAPEQRCLIPSGMAPIRLPSLSEPVRRIDAEQGILCRCQVCSQSLFVDGHEGISGDERAVGNYTNGASLTIPAHGYCRCTSGTRMRVVEGLFDSTSTNPSFPSKSGETRRSARVADDSHRQRCKLRCPSGKWLQSS